MRYAILAIIFILLAGPAGAAELSLLGGAGWKDHPFDSTYAWQVQFLEGLDEHFAYSLAYINQGHFIDHHRDGTEAILWTRTNLLDQRLSLAAGLGALYYFDTQKKANSVFEDTHSWGGSTNLAATWYGESPWFYELQGYWVWSDSSFDSLAILAGIGYQLDAPNRPGPETTETYPATKTTDNELTLLGGETIVNNPRAGHSHAIALEYRQGLWRYLEWTVGGLYEGDNPLIDRYGLTTQLWLAEPFLDQRLALAAGFGGYLAIDQRRGNPSEGKNHDLFLTEIVSFSGSLRLDLHWSLRFTWDRIVTDYDRDSDVLLGGLGYRF